MSSRAVGLVASLVMTARYPRTTQAREEATPRGLFYQAEASCPDRADFAALVRERAPLADLEPMERRQADVEVALYALNAQFTGKLARARAALAPQRADSTEAPPTFRPRLGCSQDHPHPLRARIRRWTANCGFSTRHVSPLFFSDTDWRYTGNADIAQDFVPIDTGAGHLAEANITFMGNGRAGLDFFECGSTTPTRTKVYIWGNGEGDASRD